MITHDDRIGLSCGHIFGFVGKYGDFPALMDSARARLNTTQASKRPCRNPGSEHAGLTLRCHHFILTFATVGKRYAYMVHRYEFLPRQAGCAYAALRYSASLVHNAQAIRAFLFAIATVAIFFPRRCSKLMIQRLRASVLRRARWTVARAP